MSEEQFINCMHRIVQKDHSGLKEIYDCYLKYIYSIILGVVGNKEDAEDLASEFFIKLYQNAAKYVGGNGHKGYMATIARNMAIDHLRKRKREVLESFTAEDDEIPYDPPSDNDTEKEVLENITLKEALDKLNEKERQIINMKILSEMTFQEIADVLKSPLGTVTWRYREAIKKLKRCGYDE